MSPKYTEEEVIREIRRVSEEFCDGDTPTNEDFREYGSMASSMPATKFGSWNEAIKEAQLETNVEYGLNEEEFISSIKSISEEYCGGDAPTYKKFHEYSSHSANTVVQKFGSWNDALIASGFEPTIPMNTPLPKLSEDINRVSEEYCNENPPTLGDIREYGRFSGGTYRQRFGSWFDALSESGFEVGYSKDWPLGGKEHPSWEGGYESYYGPSWFSQREKAWERDGFKCRVCGITEEEIGRKPHVHHIKPNNEWDVEQEHEEMNSLDNLISLCPSHHRVLEGEFIDSNPEEFLEKARVFLNE